MIHEIDGTTYKALFRKRELLGDDVFQVVIYAQRPFIGSLKFWKKISTRTLEPTDRFDNHTLRRLINSESVYYEHTLKSERELQLRNKALREAKKQSNVVRFWLFELFFPQK